MYLKIDEIIEDSNNKNELKWEDKIDITITFKEWIKMRSSKTS